MASVQFGGGISAMVGSAGGNTFALNRAGPYMKRRGKVVNPRSSPQVLNRVLIAHLSSVYSFTLSDADRAAWRSLASITPTINRLGNTTFLSGQQLFCKLNAQVYHFGGSYNTAAPGSLAVSTPTAMVISAVHGGGGHLTINTTVPGLVAPEVMMYLISPPMNPGRNFISSQLRRMQGFFTGNAVDTLTTDYTDVFGHLPSAAGQRVFVRGFVVNTTTGAVSSGFQASDLWT